MHLFKFGAMIAQNLTDGEKIMVRKNLKFDYVWVIIGACFLMEFVFLGFGTANSGIYMTGITDALGFKRSLFSIHISIRYLTTTFINIFFGSLVKKFGIKKLVATGFVCAMISAVINAYASSLWVFYLAGVFLGFGNALTGTTMGSFIVNRWCKTNVGRMTGLVLCANGIGGAVAAQIITPIIYSETNPFGYRSAYKMVAVLMAVAAIIVLSLLREKPDDGTLAVVPNKKKVPENTWAGIAFETVKKRPYFYVMAACVFFTGMILYGISGVKAAHMRDVKLDATAIASIVSLGALVLTFSKVLVGVACDRFGFRPVMLVCHVLTVASVVLIAMITPTASGVAVAIAASIIMAFALPLETIMISLLVKYMYGAASYAKILGIYMACNTVGFALGSPLTNLAYDTFASYVPYFLASAVVMAVVAVAAQLVMHANRKDKKAQQTV